MSYSTAQRTAPPRRARPGPILWVVGLAVRLLLLAVLGLVVSIVVEWTGMTFVWPEEGAAHSRRMLETEIGYLDRDFRASVAGSHPVELARAGGSLAYRYSGLAWLQGQLEEPAIAQISMDGRIRRAVSTVMTYVEAAMPYVEAAANISQVYGVRIAVVVLSLPVFVLFGAVALVDGLVMRDLRRFGGGLESSFVYHHLKRLLKPVVWIAVVVYMATPFSVHPSVVFLPAAALSALIAAQTAARFKKFL